MLHVCPRSIDLQVFDFWWCHFVPQTVPALGVLTLLLRALERYLDPVTLPVSIFPCNLHYLVTPTLKNTQ